MGDAGRGLVVLGSNVASLGTATLCKPAFWKMLPSCSPDLVMGRTNRACLNGTLLIRSPAVFPQLAHGFPGFLEGQAACSSSSVMGSPWLFDSNNKTKFPLQ